MFEGARSRPAAAAVTMNDEVLQVCA